MASPLPSYKHPPITEVVVGVAFRDAPGLTVAHLGDLWGREWRARFPNVEEHPPYVAPVERFDAANIGPSVSVQLLAKPTTRLWFVTADGQELIQAQNEWFACNWRKVSPGAEYDRWPARRDAFAKHFADLEGMIRDGGLGQVAVTQCEVSYINHIPATDGPKGQWDLARVLRFAAPVSGVPPVEQMQFGATFAMPNDRGAPVGRLHVTVQPASLRQDRTPIFVLNLTARGKAEGEGLAGALRFLERGREWIVRTFDAITTDAMHAEWVPDA